MGQIQSNFNTPPPLWEADLDYNLVHHMYRLAQSLWLNYVAIIILYLLTYTPSWGIDIYLSMSMFSTWAVPWFFWGGPRIDKARDDDQIMAIFSLKSWSIGGGGHGPVASPGTALGSQQLYYHFNQFQKSWFLCSIPILSNSKMPFFWQVYKFSFENPHLQSFQVDLQKTSYFIQID